jgi:hypothetical protein
MMSTEMIDKESGATTKSNDDCDCCSAINQYFLMYLKQFFFVIFSQLYYNSRYVKIEQH